MPATDITAAVAIISLLMLLQEQFEKQFSGNIDNIDMVIGAKGSPLQLILSPGRIEIFLIILPLTSYISILVFLVNPDTTK